MLSNRRGFTLMEMMVVVIIGATLVAATAPSVGRGMARARVKRAASVVAGDLELAFSNAARQRKPVRVTFSSGSLSYTVTDRATGTVLFTRDFGPSSEFALESFSASAATLDIYPNGVASSADTLRLQRGTHSRRVTVTRVGLVRGVQ